MPSTFYFTWILEREVQKFKLISFGLLASYIFILVLFRVLSSFKFKGFVVERGEIK